MAIRVYLDDVLRARGMTAKELCAKVGITEANLSILRSGKARGVRFGRRPMARLEGSEECLLAYKNGEISAREAARRLHISHATFLKWAKESEPAKQN